MNQEKTDEDIIILGTGLTGWSAALYATRAGLNPLVMTGTEIGGQVAAELGFTDPTRQLTPRQLADGKHGEG